MTSKTAMPTSSSAKSVLSSAETDGTIGAVGAEQIEVTLEAGVGSTLAEDRLGEVHTAIAR